MYYLNQNAQTRIKSWISASLFAILFGGTLFTTLMPQTVSAANCSTSFFGIPAWYEGLVDANCKVVDPAVVGGLSNFIWRIALNIVEMGLLVSGYIAVGFIIYGGFKYITSMGSPEKSANARQTIFNAVIGLVIAVSSIAIVHVVAATLVGGAVDPTTGLPVVAADSATLANILNTVYFWAGSIAVLMIVIGGVLYVTSGGNPSNVTKAKDTIIYSLVGLVVIILAFSITQFVLGLL